MRPALYPESLQDQNEIVNTTVNDKYEKIN